jgi:ubiquinone/menaquinone biosynthesis C-methylase UbiE
LQNLLIFSTFKQIMETKEINNRYSLLADTACCLSCGGAVNYAGANTGETCVDLGSGRGTDVLRLAGQVGETGFVYGLDISEGMLEKSRRNAEKFNTTNVRFIRSELEKLDLPDNTADLVISNCTINHVENKQSVWNEIYRILKKGGRFVISDIYSTAEVPVEYKKDPLAIAECWAGSVTRSEYLAHLENAGFSTLKIIEESAPYEKGKIKVVSWTISAVKPAGESCCCC